jgi:pyruvate dehydrogenase E1 component subunit alpha
MDVVDTHAVMNEAIRRAREERQPMIVEAITYRFRGHSMADPEEYRSKEQVEEWRKRDPIANFTDRLVEESVLEEGDADRLDEEAVASIDEAVTFADRADFPPPESLYDHIYVMGDEVKGWYSIDERSAGVHKGEDERSLAESERGPTGDYDEAIKQATKEDVGLDKAADEAQAESDEAEHGEDD